MKYEGVKVGLMNRVAGSSYRLAQLCSVDTEFADIRTHSWDAKVDKMELHDYLRAKESVLKVTWSMLGKKDLDERADIPGLARLQTELAVAAKTLLSLWICLQKVKVVSVF